MGLSTNKKRTVVFKYTKAYYSALKGEEILLFTIVQDIKKLEDIKLNEISQTQEDKYSTISLIF